MYDEVSDLDQIVKDTGSLNENVAEVSGRRFLGEERMRIGLNSSGFPQVDQAKRLAADLINAGQSLRNELAASCYDKTPEFFQEKHGETLRLIEQSQHYAELAGILLAKAHTA